MKDIGDNVKNKHHLDTLGLEIPENDKFEDDTVEDNNESVLCSLGGIRLVRCPDPDVGDGERDGVGGLHVDGLQRLHDPGVQLVHHLRQLLLPELVGKLLTHSDAVAVRRLQIKIQGIILVV